MAVAQKKLARKVNQARKTGNRHKWVGRNNGPARQKYWSSDRLRQNKIKKLMRHNGMTRQEAHVFWTAARQGRMKK